MLRKELKNLNICLTELIEQIKDFSKFYNRFIIIRLEKETNCERTYPDKACENDGRRTSKP